MCQEVFFTFSRPTGISNSENPTQKYEFIMENDFPNALEKMCDFLEILLRVSL